MMYDMYIYRYGQECKKYDTRDDGLDYDVA